MNTADETRSLSRNPMVGRLKEKEIHRVVIIDDAYNLPARSDFDHNELADFWAALDSDSHEQQQSLHDILGLVPRSEDEISDAGVAALYEHRNALGILQEAFDKYLRPPLEQKHAALDRFAKYLQGELGLEVVVRGASVDAVQPQVDIIFLDYYLSTPRDEASIATTREITQWLLKAYPVGTKKPLVVLMSSYDGVREQSEDFRSQTGIVGGMFFFIPKSDLTDEFKLLLNLDILAAALPVGHRIQKFIDAVENKADSVKSEFLAGIKRLNLDDYVYIQRLSLQADGHPLGDYLLWLYSAYFGHLLFEGALGDQRRELDRLTFTDWVPSHVVPSRQLTALYHAALFDTTIGPLSEHPRCNLEPCTQVPGTNQETAGGNPPCNEHTSSTIETAMEAAKRLPYLNLGDVFVDSSSTQLLMVINPACDLEFTPDDKRLPESQNSIMFIPGKLERPGSALPSVGLRTELFEYNNETFRVVWQPKRVKTITHEEVADWLQSNGFTRVARLRMPFCLEVQHYFAADMTRVGVPVAPPFYRPLHVEVFKRETDGSSVRLPITESDAEAFVIETRREGEKCVFTTSLVRALHRYLNEIPSLDRLSAAEAGLSNQEAKQRERANKRIDKAHESLKNFSAWHEVSAPFACSRGKFKHFEEAGIVVWRDVSDKQWVGESLLMVCISEVVVPTTYQIDEEPPIAVVPQASTGLENDTAEGTTEGTQPAREVVVHADEAPV